MKLPHIPKLLRRNSITAILLVGYIFMSLLIIEQGRTIENQKSLIRQLYGDSLELSASKLRHNLHHR
jgi:hypothetical protein